MDRLNMMLTYLTPTTLFKHSEIPTALALSVGLSRILLRVSTSAINSKLLSSWLC